MKSFRLALPVAALAAVFGMNYVAAAEIASAQQFSIEENRAQPEQNNQPASEPAAANPAAETNEPQPQAKAKKNANAWTGIRTASLAPELSVPANNPAPAANADNAPIFALIDKHAAANGLPVAFARAIVRVESNYNPKVTGRAGEVGLMQIKYETAKGIGYTGSRADLYDPDTNLQWGMKYLAMAWKLGGSNPCGAVMKYQGGHAVTQPNAANHAYCAKVKAHMASN
jgi:soluble lytic murein transglycosylase-like protein